MPVDYILEMIEELGRAMRAIIARKKDQPAKALEEIRVAFNGTKFGNKGFFDGLSKEELGVFLREQQVDYRAADYIVDILLVEADINREMELERLAMGGVEGLEERDEEGQEDEAGEKDEERQEDQKDQPYEPGASQVQLLEKIQVLIDYIAEVETSLKIFSLKRGQQRERLNSF